MMKMNRFDFALETFMITPDYESHFRCEAAEVQWRALDLECGSGRFTLRALPKARKDNSSGRYVMTTPRTIRAPRGAQLNCKGWHQEAAMRCLMNNLDS